MSNTLNYDSCARWMGLAVWALDLYREWKIDPQLTYMDESYTRFFHEIAVEALNRGFSLRAGYRASAIASLIVAIAPGDDKLFDAFYRINREDWLTPPGARAERKQSNG